MLLQEIFDQLTVGELSQLHIGGIDSVGIRECDYAKVVPNVNLGLLELYKRFDLKRDELTIQQYDGINDYVLTPKFAESNVDSVEPIKYIKDLNKPFMDNILIIESILGSDGKEIALNDTTQDKEEYDEIKTSISYYTPVFNTLRIPNPVNDVITLVRYRARPDTISTIGLKPMDYEVELSYTLLEPLLYFIASRMLTSLNAEGSLATGTNYMQKYELACKRIEQFNLVNVSNTSNDKLEFRGFV